MLYVLWSRRERVLKRLNCSLPSNNIRSTSSIGVLENNLKLPGVLKILAMLVMVNGGIANVVMEQIDGTPINCAIYMPHEHNPS